ncbi:uncharacterized protein FIBRA_06474 [Fibroporia radiculosa]|uniref:Uncharacterized protein n=1 Tax=Fibroporia radiculosa TaxID=599839 RepID=J4GBL1_9APHY|nr:uncharacterized protein FIBRA_06474 [Fibroporia radiculosa]CCM04303.1 predicted protein [Fibroporia radiculosa]
MAVVPAMVGALTVNTITTGVTECQPVLFTWSGGEAPYYLSLVPGKSTSSTPLRNFGEQQGTSYTWDVDAANGTQFTTVLKDSTGAIAFSDEQTVQSGTNSSCVVAAAAPSTSSSETTSEGSSTNSDATTSSAPTTSSPASPTTTTSSGSSHSSSTSSTGSAPTTGSNSGSGAASSGASRTSTAGAFGVAAVMGLIGAALF